MKFNTTEYQSSHGRKPTGTGDWFFVIEGKMYNFYGPMRMSAKAALDASGAKKSATITVLP